MVMEAFLFRIGPGIEFPRRPSCVENIRLQMLALAKAFRGPFGSMIKALLGEAQLDAELAEAFRTRWITPRREAAKEVIQSAIKNKELRPDVDVDQALDALYGGLYYRLMIEAVEEVGHEQVYRLTGGRLVNYKDGYAALVSYQMQQQTISLLVSSSKSATAAGGEEVPSGGIVFHYSKRLGFAVITWSTHGLTYALVSSLPGSGRQSCMVCHQNTVNGGHF
jgi:hypothetical protein